PKACSSSGAWRDRLGWLSPEARAAAENDPDSATRWKARSCVGVIYGKPLSHIWNIYWTHRGREAKNCRMTTPARSETGDPLLLTPGPLTTSASVKQAMVHD